MTALPAHQDAGAAEAGITTDGRRPSCRRTCSRPARGRSAGDPPAPGGAGRGRVSLTRSPERRRRLDSRATSRSEPHGRNDGDPRDDPFSIGSSRLSACRSARCATTPTRGCWCRRVDTDRSAATAGRGWTAAHGGVLPPTSAAARGDRGADGGGPGAYVAGPWCATTTGSPHVPPGCTVIHQLGHLVDPGPHAREHDMTATTTGTSTRRPSARWPPRCSTASGSCSRKADRGRRRPGDGAPRTPAATTGPASAARKAIGDWQISRVYMPCSVAASRPCTTLGSARASATQIDGGGCWPRHEGILAPYAVAGNTADRVGWKAKAVARLARSPTPTTARSSERHRHPARSPDASRPDGLRHPHADPVGSAADQDRCPSSGRAGPSGVLSQMSGGDPEQICRLPREPPRVPDRPPSGVRRRRPEIRCPNRRPTIPGEQRELGGEEETRREARGACRSRCAAGTGARAAGTRSSRRAETAPAPPPARDRAGAVGREPEALARERSCDRRREVGPAPASPREPGPRVMRGRSRRLPTGGLGVGLLGHGTDCPGNPAYATAGPRPVTSRAPRRHERHTQKQSGHRREIPDAWVYQRELGRRGSLSDATAWPVSTRGGWMFTSAEFSGSSRGGGRPGFIDVRF